MTGNPLSANFPVPGSVSTSEPRTGGSVAMAAESEALTADRGIPEIAYRLVIGGCHCWWVESVPAGVVTDPDAPRVCSLHRASHSASMYPSPQGMAMVNVVYVTDAALVDAARELM